MDQIQFGIRGEIRWYHVTKSRALRKVIERAVARWAEVQGIAGRVSQYRAVLQREGDGHLVHCQIEVIEGPRRWIGSWVGEGIQQAALECLTHMTPSFA